MSYIDDFGSTSEDTQKKLLETCQDPRCAHLRYQHGRAPLVRRGYYRFIEHEPGVCTMCRCKVFWEDSPITEDDVLDVAVALRYDVRLDDIGVKAWTGERCAAIAIRHTGAGQLTAQCKLEKNHSEKDHDPDFNDLRAEGK